MLQPQVKGLADLRPVRLAVGEDYDLDQLAADLVGAAYVRVDLVERRGEFAVRGGIVDIFPPTEEHPVRIDFFGDEIEEIRYFTVADQRSGALTLPDVVASPCRELLLTEQVRNRAAALAVQHPELIEMLDKIAQGHAVDGMEALSPALVDGMELLIDLLPPDTHVLVSDPELVRGRAIDLVKVSEEFLQASWAAAAGGGQAPIDLGSSSYRPLAEVRQHALERGMAWWTLSPFSAGPESVHPSTSSGLDAGPSTGSGTEVRTEDGELIDFSAAVSTAGVESRTIAGRTGRAIAATPRRRPPTSASGFGRAGGSCSPRRVTDWPSGWPRCSPSTSTPCAWSNDFDEPPVRGLATIVCADLQHGFLADGIELALFTAGDLSGSADRRTRPAARCRRGGRTRSTRWNWSAATRSCTASTGSGATSR